MLARLQDIERRLGSLLELPGWRTALVSRHAPVTHRAWRQVDPLTRCYLHRMFPHDDAGWPHHHPWPFAVRILRGGYFMQVHRDGRTVEARTLREGDTYEMLDPAEAHSIHVQEETWSIVVTGAPYLRTVSRWRDEGPMPELHPGDRAALLRRFPVAA